MRYELVIFDFDGTIADTFPPIVTATNDALESCGFPARPEGEIRPLIGLPLEVVMERLAGRRCTHGEVEKLCARYRERFDVVAPGATRLYDGIEEVVRGAAAAGLALAIATSRGRPSLESILDAHDLREPFGLLLGGSCVTHKKPHPEMVHRALHHFRASPNKTLVVGDTTFDIEMGKAAGAATCAVTWGFHPEAELAFAEPDHIVHQAHELRALLACGA